MYRYVLVIGAIVGAQAFMHDMVGLRSDSVSPYFNVNNLMLRELLERMGSELAAAEAGDPYMDSRESSSALRGLSDKEIPLELPFDYDSIDALNPKASIRDQEYLQHSSLWSNQALNNNNHNNYKTNDRHNKVQPGVAAAAVGKQSKDEKTESQLPAYCTPPNPCPVGYTSENNCIENFENTAAFSREYQSAQDCMCDSEHMLECPSGPEPDDNSLSAMSMTNADFDQIVERFQEENPFFHGEKLPIAAKKGINVGF
ncbi:neuroendocrine protein 7B2 [Copidosoma floridanum]|uniref:neuroendocrine protein 7B2 n=1 Tax=Copidosoma floridanum TaxID=29053 RepID=UPI0006C9D7AE|nr:neuroendocrine protein 7B2 [Copidosoma floridanum]